MPEMTRRSFLKQSGATAAAAGAVAVAPKLLRPASSRPSRKGAAVTSAAGKEAMETHHLVVHVPDTRKDELRLLVGHREVVLHDRALVARLSRASD